MNCRHARWEISSHTGECVFPLPRWILEITGKGGKINTKYPYTNCPAWEEMNKKVEINIYCP
jgi:hypothetical protein